VTDVTVGSAEVTAITVKRPREAHGVSIETTGRQVRHQQEPNMSAFTSKPRQAGLVLAFALTVSAVSSTQSFAFSSEARSQCTGDAFKFCSSEIPNIPAITACMFKHKAQLSTGCRAVMDKDIASKSKKVADSD
jgi:hypothetical protein